MKGAPENESVSSQIGLTSAQAALAEGNPSSAPHSAVHRDRETCTRIPIRGIEQAGLPAYRSSMTSLPLGTPLTYACSHAE